MKKAKSSHDGSGMGSMSDDGLFQAGFLADFFDGKKLV